MKVMVLLLWAGLLVASPAAAQHDQHHAALDARGATFMGFDQTATAHHFILTKDGGRIEVTAKNAKTPRRSPRSGITSATSPRSSARETSRSPDWCTTPRPCPASMR